MFLVGSDAHIRASVAFNNEVERLKNIEGVDVSDVSVVLDSFNASPPRTKKWWEDGPWP